MKYRNEILDTPVDTLCLSTRLYNILRHEVPRVEYVGDLMQMTERQLMRAPNCGRKTVSEVKELLAAMRLHLGMNVKVYLEETAVSSHCWGP